MSTDHGTSINLSAALRGILELLSGKKGQGNHGDSRLHHRTTKWGEECSDIADFENDAGATDARCITGIVVGITLLFHQLVLPNWQLPGRLQKPWAEGGRTEAVYCSTRVLDGFSLLFLV
jgi:hypothetical protein